MSARQRIRPPGPLMILLRIERPGWGEGPDRVDDGLAISSGLLVLDLKVEIKLLVRMS